MRFFMFSRGLSVMSTYLRPDLRDFQKTPLTFLLYSATEMIYPAIFPEKSWIFQISCDANIPSRNGNVLSGNATDNFCNGDVPSDYANVPPNPKPEIFLYFCGQN
jgi:hypothetical protein